MRQCRWPGASLIVIRGHKHLHDCAYIGDDSSEELEEIAKALTDGTYNDTSNSSESDANSPHFMKRHRPEVHFHHPYHGNGTKNHSIDAKHDTSDVTDPKLLKTLLDALSKKTQKMNEQCEKIKQKIEDEKLKKIALEKSMNLTLKNVSKAQLKPISHIEKIPPKKPSTLPTTEHSVVTQNDTSTNSYYLKSSVLETNSSQTKHVNKESYPSKFKNLTVSEKDIAVLQASITSEREVRNEESNLPSASEELYQELSKKLDLLGDKQYRVLQRLNNRAFPNPLESKQKNNKIGSRKRRKRDIIISPVMRHTLNEDDEKGNSAIEEEFKADGIADHHGSINETTLNDRSSSEFWSSFSSSEEALLNCEGLILNLPLTPHEKCDVHKNEEDFEEASITNKVTYKIPSNGYYFFVFNSENEVQVNYIRLRFHLNKTVYDVSNPVSSCANKTDSCALDLKFFSNEKIVMEVPITTNQSRWNEEFVVVSECQPRTIVYMCCVLAVPILIMLFAFQ